jgi:hypothetical protein
MAIRPILIGIASLLFASCAQVGLLTGGQEDTKAPTPLEELTSPANKTVRFSGNGFSLTFDEFIQLNNPQQTVVVSPANLKPELSIENKTVHVRWKDTLRENTTYVVYLNGTIKDISEGNDTLITYVFSTGSSIDSLRFSIPVVDAFTSKPLKDITVGLFKDSLTSSPLYFARTSPLGWAEFQYLKAGNYFVRAFEDKNKDLSMQSSEPLAFRSNPLRIDSVRKDSSALRLFLPKPDKWITSFRFQAPGSFTITGNSSMKGATITCNGQAIDTSKIIYHSEDSLQFFTSTSGANKFDLRLELGNSVDSATVRILEKNKGAALQLRPTFNNAYVSPLDSVKFQVNDLISSVDTSKFILRKLPSGDTLQPQFSIDKNTLVLSFHRAGVKQLLFSVKKGGVIGTSGALSDSLSSTIELKNDRDFGGISFSLEKAKTPAIVQLIGNGKVVREKRVEDQGKHTFEMLQPGEYTFRIIEDDNQNGIWDTGALLEGIQPEVVRLFSTPVVVRSNWLVNIKLSQ